MTCVYCLAGGKYSICLDCRTKFDIAKKDAEYYKREYARQRTAFFRVTKENERLKEALKKKEKGRK